MSNVEAFFNPRGIAVIGVSTDPTKPSSAIYARLLENQEARKLKVPVYPVNPKYDEIEGRKVYPSIGSIKGPVDLVIIAIPAEYTPSVIEDVGKKGAKAAVVISGGFSESGREDLKRALLEAARKWGIRIMGPNTIGLLDTYTGVDTLFLPKRKKLTTGEELESLPEPKRGNLVIITQSGVLGEITMDSLFKSRIGVRALIGLGNQIDLSVEELLGYFAKDERTSAIMLYLEGVKDGRSFIRSAHRAALKKPIIVLKAGKTKVGAKAAFTHTASMVGNIDLYRAVFKQIGLIEAHDLEEFIDFGKVYSIQRPASGKRLLILSNAGGAAVLASDVAPSYGLQLPPLGREEKRALDELKKNHVILPMVVYTNPVDLTGSATTEGMVKAYDTLAKSPNFDLHLIIPTHQPPTLNELVIDGIAEVARKVKKPVVGCEMGESEWSVLFRNRMDHYGIPSFPTPERAIRALYALTLYRRKPLTDMELSKENRLKWLRYEEEELTIEAIEKILEEYGIPIPPTAFVTDEFEVRKAASKVGYPLVLKAMVKGVSHKTDVGGVVLSLRNEEEVISAFRNMHERMSKKGFEIRNVLLQKMVSGTEIILGSIWDEQFGPVVSVGVGGVYTELMKDFSVRAAPVTKEEALEMLRELKLGTILDGFRGRKPVDRIRLAEIVSNFSNIMPENPSINQLEINPLMGEGRRFYAVDVRGLVKK